MIIIANDFSDNGTLFCTNFECKWWTVSCTEVDQPELTEVGNSLEKNLELSSLI